jgi:hypothetical protein
MKYVIRLGPDGYYGSVIWGYSPIEQAKVFDSRKEAHRLLNRVRDRFHYSKSEIEPYEPSRNPLSRSSIKQEKGKESQKGD